MATIVDLIVKKADGTTNITWTAVNGAAGDKLPASWRSETAASFRGNRPTYLLSTQDNGAKTARRANGKVVFPITRTINSVEVVVDKVIVDFSAIVPNALSDAEISEAVSQAFNVIGATVTIASVKSGTTPN